MRECPICHYCYEDELVLCPQDQMALQDTLPGTTRIDHYLLTQLIARETISSVYRARQANLRDVAIKILSPDLLANAPVRERFRREALALANLKHPNIVTIFDFGISDQGLIYLVMELLTGRTLAARLIAERRLEIPEAIRIVTAIGQALGLAHSQGVVHYNIKPTNIFLARQESAQKVETVKLIDFGLAQLQENAQRITTGALIGSLHYTAPEQCREGEVDRRADIYALAAVMYHLLTGQPPFLATNKAQLIQQQLNATPLPLRRFIFDIAPELESIILKALAKDPNRRPQSIAEFTADIAAAPQQGRRRTVGLFVEDLAKRQSPTRSVPQFDQFVGHQRECEKVATAYAHQQSGQPRLLLLVGAPGIGRSRLLQVAVAPLVAQGALVLTGRFTASATSLLTITNLKQYLAALDHLAPQQFAQLFGSITAPLRDLLLAALPATDETRTQEIIVQAISQLANQQPVVLALDDLHYADAASLKLISYLLRTAAHNPLFLIFTASDPYLAQPANLAAHWLENIASKRQLQRIMVEPLTIAEVEALLEKEFAPAVFSPTTLQQIYLTTGGNPRYLISLLQFLLAKQQIIEQQGHWQFAELPVNFSLPETLLSLINEYLAFVTPASREILSHAALLGTIWGFEALRQSVQWAEDQLIPLVEECLRYGLLIEATVADGNDDYYQFTSRPVQQALYQQWSAAVRHERHLQVAKILQNLARPVSVSPERQAAIQHWCWGGNYRNAFCQQVLALHIAWDNEEYSLAQQYWQQAKELIAEFDYQPLLMGREAITTSVGLATALAEYFIFSVELQGASILLPAEEILDQALRLAQRLHQPLLMAQVFITMGKRQQHLGNYDLAQRYWENALGFYSENEARYQAVAAQIAVLSSMIAKSSAYEEE
jgi:serine/threonine protein kinase/tetratricopeptide (TPR) repeat protein